MQLAWISLTLSCQLSLSSIAPGRSSRLHSMSILRHCRYVLLGHPTLVCRCERVHRKTSQMISSVILQQYPTCLIYLIWMVLEIGGWCLYNCCFVGCGFHNLFNIACYILVQFLPSLFSIRFISIHVVYPYIRTDTTAPWNLYIYIYIYIYKRYLNANSLI